MPSTFDFASGLPATILKTVNGEKQEVKTADALGGKVYALYFSAHWCPPCRGFTPKLAETYTMLESRGQPFEIVFVSSDKGQDEFDEYFGEHPWAAVKYEERAVKDALSKTFKVSGIPSLAIIDSDGTVITTDGRSAVGGDPEGNKFPWKPKSLTDILGTVSSYDKADGTSVPASSLEGKVIGLYFSAHWCPPCKAFTPVFAEMYKKLQAAGKPFEVVFVSSDKSEAQFKEYMGEMPWLALPYSERDLKGELSEYFGVSGIPSLAIVDADEKRTTITKQGRGSVSGDADDVIAAFPWHPKPFNDVNKQQDGLNEETCLVLLTDGVEDKAEFAKAVAALETVATAAEAKAKESKGEMPFRFFFASPGAVVVEQIRKLTGQEGKLPAMVMLDIPDQGGYYVAKSASMEVGDIEDFVANYKSGERKQMS
jgi:nucleoredoxin